MARTIILLYLFSLQAMVLTTFAQEIDDPTEADADAAFFAIGRYYKSISPIINKMHDWKDWETNYDSIAKFQRAEKIQGGQAINFIFEEFTDDNGDPVGDTIEYLQNNLHYLDYDNDGFEDLIFEQKLSYRGHRIKVYRGNGKHYDLAYKFTGMIVAMDRDESNGALHLTIYDYPCCDGYVHVLQSYIPVMNNDTIQYQLNRVDKYVESNVRRLKNLPESFITEESFTTKTEAVVLYRAVRPVFQKFEPGSGHQDKYKNFHPFAILPENSEGMVLHETLGQTNTGNDTLVFVRFSGILDQTNSIRHLVKKNFNESRQSDHSRQTYYYGWIDKEGLEIE